VVRPGGVLAAAVWDFRGGLVYQRLFWDTAAGLDPDAGATRDRLFSSPLALPDGLPAAMARKPVSARSSAGRSQSGWNTQILPIIGNRCSAAKVRSALMLWGCRRSGVG